MNLAVKSLRITLILALFTFLPEIGHGAVVLQYHHVDTSTPAITTTPPDIYISHLQYIEDNDFEVVALQQLIDTPEAESDNRIAITFDDAYANLLQTAIPELTKRGWPFTIFVATEFVGQSGYLSWVDLQAIETAGGSIANHTHSHLHMVRLLENETDSEWLKRIEAEITGTQKLLEANLKSPPKHFAYPYGEYNLAILELVERLGFVGFGQQSGAIGKFSDHRLLPRFPLSGIYANFDTFKVKLHTQALPVQVPYVPPLITQNPPSFSFEFVTTEGLRLHQLTCYGPGGATELIPQSKAFYTAQNRTGVPVGRSRYNCTMPIENSSHFYWLSQLWMRKQNDGSWYPE